MRTAKEKTDKIDSLTIRYCTGEISEAVYQVSLMGMLPKDEIRYLIQLHQLAHRNTMAYKRGDIS